MRSMGLLFALVILTFLPDSKAAWGPRGCAAVVAPEAVQADGWYHSSAWAGWRYQMRAGACVAWWNPATCEYRPVVGGKMQPAAVPPWEKVPVGSLLPDHPDKAEWEMMTKGVDTAKIVQHSHPIYTTDGQLINRDTAVELVAGKGDVPDDAGKCTLTVVCRDPNDPRRKAILRDLASNPSLAELRGKCVIQDIPERRSYWMPDGSPTKLKKTEQTDVALVPFKLDRDTRYQASGFAVYFQVAPDAKGQAPVKGARYDYVGDTESLRRIDPLYEPDKIPDGKPKPKPPDPPPEPKPDPKPDMDTGTLALMACGGMLLFILFGRKEQR